MQQPKSKEEKLALINECRNSGLPDNKWCKQHNIPVTTLHGWVKKFESKGYHFPDPVGRKVISATNEVVKLDILPDFSEEAHADQDTSIDKSCSTSASLETPAIEMTLGDLNIRFLGDINPLLFEKALAAFGGRL